ncbi:MAG: AgmX/PglI C-terminal domain-containing protein [Sandaracinus sp.]|nr:AgmX/PglI C-terminal domain-containing protein [Myxococcales bacterium]MCB9599894.1 AgmX/PglI C-terminal domain-containing protein [Sandaracinus sp.]MCB9635240.1 AgmX/PglI C-terminal domain-containing protein [Sandaracinus sp.]
MRRLAIAPVGLILLAALWFFFRSDGSNRSPDVGDEARASVPSDASVPDATVVAERLAESEATAGSRRRSREEVAELRAAIEAARNDRVREAARELAANPNPTAAAAAVQVPPEQDAERLGRLDAQYIRDAIRDLQPLLRECYDLARAEAERAGEAAPEGRLVTRFVIGGEPDVGGVIEESEVMDQSDVRHPLLEECFTQTLFTVELPAPEEGGRVTVHYPFVLRAGDDEPSE